MPSGQESYVTLMDDAPRAALGQARLHLQWLTEQQGPRVSDVGASYDPATLEAAITQTRKDIDSLRAIVRGVGVAQFVPCARGRRG